MKQQYAQFLFMFSFLLLVSPAFSQLNGNYTIGGTTPDYNTINDAVTSLDSQGGSGPGVFNIRTAVYN